MRKFKIGDRVLTTSNYGIVFEGKIVDVSQDGEDLLVELGRQTIVVMGSRAFVVKSKNCVLKQKRVVRSKKVRARLGDARHAGSLGKI